MTKIGILGATGAVGRQMLICLEERNIKKEDIKIFASKNSIGKEIKYSDGTLICQEVNENSFNDLDYVLGAVSNSLSKEYYPLIKKSKAIYIDNSSAFRLLDNVPLVVPEINGKDALKNDGIIANPNCSTIIAMMAISPINDLSKIEAVYASTYQAVSGAGKKGMEELTSQIKALENNGEITIDVFPEQIAYNCIANIGSMTENDYTTEEMKMQNEGRKIMHLPKLKVTCTCVRVPVYRSHSISLTVITKEPLNLETVKEKLKSSSDIVYFEDKIPSPLITSNQDKVYVGRIRKDLVNENGITLWCCGDQIRKGAATNAVQIMDYLETH